MWILLGQIIQKFYLEVLVPTMWIVLGQIIQNSTLKSCGLKQCFVLDYLTKQDYVWSQLCGSSWVIIFNYLTQSTVLDLETRKRYYFAFNSKIMTSYDIYTSVQSVRIYYARMHFGIQSSKRNPTFLLWVFSTQESIQDFSFVCHLKFHSCLFSLFWNQSSLCKSENWRAETSQTCFYLFLLTPTAKISYQILECSEVLKSLESSLSLSRLRVNGESE